LRADGAHHQGNGSGSGNVSIAPGLQRLAVLATFIQALLVALTG
jgi:hypothetical protein